MRAFQRADRLANGQNAEAIIGMAESLLAQDFEQIRGAAGHLFERALELEPDNPQGAALQRVRRAERAAKRRSARERFQRMLALNPPPQIRDIIEQAVAARSMRDRRAQRRAAGERRTRQGSAKVAVHVTLAPALAARCPPGAALFVAARDPKSPGPPFAAKRLPAQFPGRRRAHGGGRHARVAPHHRRTAARSRGARGPRRNADRDQRRPVRTS